MRGTRKVGAEVRFASPLPALYALAVKSVPAPKHAAHEDEMDAPHDAAKMRPYVFGGRDDRI